MGERTTIEWTNASWTPIRARWFEIQSDGGSRERIGWHCEHVSKGCRNCYSQSINKRLGTGLDFKPAHLKHKTALGDERGDVTVYLDEEMLLAPLKWKRPRKIFVCSMTDLFAGFVSDDMIDRVFAVMVLAPQHTYQVLTKRAARMRTYMTRHGGFGRWGFIEGHAKRIARGIGKPIPAGKMLIGPLPHVHLGVSVEDQPRANERIPELQATPAAVRFLSVEPLIGYVKLKPLLAGIDQVIVGGESGPRRAASTSIGRARSLRIARLQASRAS